MVHNRCSASFEDAVGPVASAGDTFAGSATVPGVSAARACAVAARHNSAGETFRCDTGWHAVPHSRASRVGCCLSDWNRRASDRIAVAASRLAADHAGVVASHCSVGSVADHAGGAANRCSADSVAAGVAGPGPAEHAGGFVPSVAAVLHAADPGSAGHAGGFVPNAVAVLRAVGPDSAGRAGGFVPNVVAAGRAAGPDSVGRAGDSVPVVPAGLIQSAALHVELHAAVVVRRAVGRLAPVGLAGPVAGVARDELRAQPGAGHSDPDLAAPRWPGYFPVPGRDVPGRALRWRRRLAAPGRALPKLRGPSGLLSLYFLSIDC